MQMNILILGSGGREHALAWKIRQSNKTNKLYIAPGNAGTEMVGENLSVSATDFTAIKRVVLEKDINMVVVGPEVPLVNGIYDFFLQDSELKDIPVIGPSKEGAKLEGSKKFGKEFMLRNNIPTAKYKSVTKETLKEGIQFLESMSPPYVLKADGLAAGKGVIILNERAGRPECKGLRNRGNRESYARPQLFFVQKFDNKDGHECTSHTHARPP